MENKQPTGSPVGWTIVTILSVIGGFIAAATWASDRGQEMPIGGFIVASIGLFVILAIAYLASAQEQQKDKDQAETNAAIRRHLEQKDGSTKE